MSPLGFKYSAIYVEVLVFFELEKAILFLLLLGDLLGDFLYRSSGLLLADFLLLLAGLVLTLI